jgi:hypothetical protein
MAGFVDLFCCAWLPENSPGADLDSGDPVLLCDAAAQASIIRCLFGNPFAALPRIDTAWLTWNNGTVKRLAEEVYQNRQLPAGTLEPAVLGVLADALTDAGCDDTSLLAHLRDPGPHWRGCWGVDLLLGRT